MFARSLILVPPADLVAAARSLRSRSEPPTTVLHTPLVERRRGLLRLRREEEEMRGVVVRGWVALVDRRPMTLVSSASTLHVPSATGLLLDETGHGHVFRVGGPSATDLREMRVQQAVRDTGPTSPHPLAASPPPLPFGSYVVGPLTPESLCTSGFSFRDNYPRRIPPAEVMRAVGQLAAGGGPTSVPPGF